MIKNYQVSKNLQTQISGESLFNDGLGVVVFLTVLAVAKEGTASFDLGETGMLFVEEVFGGIILGLIIGLVGLWMLKWIDNKHTEIEVLITLSMVMGGSLLAHMWHFSAPLAMVVMGLTVGREGRDEALAEATGEYVYKFWHLTDEALNAILFILIGLQILLVEWAPKFVLAAIIAIPIVLGARFLGTGTPITILRTKKTIHRLTVRVLTWGGLRGGISVALALSLRETLPEVYETERMVIDAIIAMTYSVVAFSIIVQGLTVGRIFDQIQADEEARNAAA
jgi:CPA1 family monovalent cation:H+ antiporter